MSAESQTTREREQQAEALSAIIRASLSDLVGKRLTPEVAATIQQRASARIRIADQLIEYEDDTSVE